MKYKRFNFPIKGMSDAEIHTLTDFLSMFVSNNIPVRQAEECVSIFEGKLQLSLDNGKSLVEAPDFVNETSPYAVVDGFCSYLHQNACLIVGAQRIAKAMTLFLEKMKEEGHDELMNIVEKPKIIRSYETLSDLTVEKLFGKDK